jgi:hypothetical protein
MRANLKDVAAGLFFIVVGVFVAFYAMTHLTMGTSFRMGPGYFPAFTGGLVALLGLVILLRAPVTQATPFGAVPWRAMALISLAPVVFGICIRGLGFAPTVALTCLITCFASYKVGLLKALGITAVLTAFCLGVFHFGLGLPIEVIGPWLIG